jgi:RimJ/RimL family protein N-acetyltransferase/ribosomal protein S18 acetylase RimI-like enzyme
MIPVIDAATGLPIGPEVDARPAQRPQRTTLIGRHVLLVPLDADKHAAELYRATHGPEKHAVWLYMGDGPFADEAAFRASLVAKARSEDPLFFAIVGADSGKALGYATLMRIDPANRVIEVGNIVYSPAMQRSPGATEAMYLLARHAFEDLGYRRYEWKCHSLNAPSAAAAKRYGFVYEGLFRQAVIPKGRNRDTSWFSMLDCEWPMRKAAFERWLAPENFDTAGRQKTALSALNAQNVTVGPWTLRRAGPDDVPAIEALQQAAYRPNAAILGVEPVPLRWDYAAIMQRCEVWLAEALGKPVGVLILEMRADHVMLESVATAPGTQGTGLGNMLLTAAEFRAADYGLKLIRLYTGEKLTRNVDWYRRRGYGIEHIETVDDRRLVHMIKRL